MIPFTKAETELLRRCGWHVLDGFVLDHPIYKNTSLEKQKNGEVWLLRFGMSTLPKSIVKYKSVKDYIKVIS